MKKVAVTTIVAAACSVAVWLMLRPWHINKDLYETIRLGMPAAGVLERAGRQFAMNEEWCPDVDKTTVVRVGSYFEDGYTPNDCDRKDQADGLIVWHNGDTLCGTTYRWIGVTGRLEISADDRDLVIGKRYFEDVVMSPLERSKRHVLSFFK
jgi:hypothetical protein